MFHCSLQTSSEYVCFVDCQKLNSEMVKSLFLWKHLIFIWALFCGIWLSTVCKVLFFDCYILYYVPKYYLIYVTWPFMYRWTSFDCLQCVKIIMYWLMIIFVVSVRLLYLQYTVPVKWGEINVWVKSEIYQVTYSDIVSNM